jgi:hypothetical protein
MQWVTVVHVMTSTPQCSHSLVFENVGLVVPVLPLLGHSFFMWRPSKVQNTTLGLVPLKRMGNVHIDPPFDTFKTSHYKWPLNFPSWNPSSWSWWWQVYQLPSCKIISQYFPQRGIFFQCDTPPWFMMSWGYAILCTFLSYLDMYNYNKCHFMKASLFSLTICANLVYMVLLQPLVIHHHLTHWTIFFNFWNWSIGAL